MTITSRVHGELFAEVPTISSSASSTSNQQNQTQSHTLTRPAKLIRMPLHNPRVDPSSKAAIKNERRRQRRQRGRYPHMQQQPQQQVKGLPWTAEEHERFLRGLELYPRGPWKEVANFVGTRTVRQTMTHAQKYRQKIARHQRGLHPGTPHNPNRETSSGSSSRPGGQTCRVGHKPATAIFDANSVEEKRVVSGNGLSIVNEETPNTLLAMSTLAPAQISVGICEEDTRLSISMLSRPREPEVSLLETQSIDIRISSAPSAGRDQTLSEDSLDDLLDEGLIQHVIDQYLDTEAISCDPVASSIPARDE